MLGQEPDLQLIAANHVAHQQIVGSVVADFGSFPRHRARFFQDEFVRFEEPRNLHGHFFPAARRARNDRRLRDIRRHGDADAAEELNPFGDGVHQFVLLAMVLIKEQMELVKRRAGDLPVMLLVHVAQSHGIGENLVQVVDARFAGGFIEGDRQFGDFSVGLNFPGVLVQDGLGALRSFFQSG